jgi:Ca2+-binding RTX toxin-like protein
VFVFNSRNERGDRITDFAVAEDTLLVSASGFAGRLTPGETLRVGQFRLGVAATDSSDRFIYNENTGAIFFDSDGLGGAAQIQIATLARGLAITNENILVTA